MASVGTKKLMNIPISAMVELADGTLKTSRNPPRSPKLNINMTNMPF
jgi:hypothetical protein